MKIRCKKKECEYEWDYKGEAKFYATCPRCLSKVNLSKYFNQKKKNKTKENT